MVWRYQLKWTKELGEAILNSFSQNEHQFSSSQSPTLPFKPRALSILHPRDKSFPQIDLLPKRATKNSPGLEMNLPLYELSVILKTWRHLLQDIAVSTVVADKCCSLSSLSNIFHQYHFHSIFSNFLVQHPFDRRGFPFTIFESK